MKSDTIDKPPANLLKRVTNRIRGRLGQRDWETKDEFVMPTTLLRLDGTEETVACKWRVRVCRLSAKTQFQSNFGYEWATEWEE